MNGVNIELYNIICEEIFNKSLNSIEAKNRLSEILKSYLIIKRDNTPLKHTIDKFILDKSDMGLSKNTIDSYKSYLYMFSDFIDKQVNEITTEDIKEFLSYRENNPKKKSKNTMESIRAILKVFFDWLEEEKLIYTNPISKIKPYKLPDPFIEALTKDDLAIIRKKCISLREKALVEVLYSTGVTLSEISSLLLESINWDNNEIIVRGRRNRNRSVFLNQKAKYSLERYINMRKDDCNEVFVSSKKPYKKLGTRALEKELSKIVGRTGLDKKISSKTFRHTFAKVMLDNDCPLHILQAFLGHRDINSTSEAYGKVTNQIKKRALDTYLPE